MQFVPIPFEKMQSLEHALGFFPYGDDEQVRIGENNEYIVPDDIRLKMLGKLATGGALGGDDLRHAQALRNLEAHVAGELDKSRLYGYQQDVVKGIRSFLQYPEYDPDGQPIRAGYVKLPTATGKTVIYAHTVNEITRVANEGGQELKTLVLVPGRDLVDQTVGLASKSEESDEAEDTEEILRGFAKFAPEKLVSEYHGGKKDLNGNVVVMTYQSLNKALSENRFDLSMFDVVIGDEIHRALGPTTRTNLQTHTKNQIFLGFSATTEYAANKKVEDLLPTEIYRLELRDAVERGYLAPIRAIAITTNETIKASGRGDFSDKELAKLIENEWRNKTAINIARDFIAEGQQGIITCLPGGDLRHAREIASRLSKESVIDAKTGQIRPVVAETVSGEMTIKQRREIYRRFEAGEVDVLTTVDLLNEGWDSVRAKFLINLRPTTSQVLGVQRLGRILRPGEEDELATIVEFIDNIEKPGKGIFTFYHAMGETKISQNKIFGKPRRSQESPEYKPRLAPSLPHDLADLVAKMDHTVLDERIFGKFPPAEADEMSFNIFCKLAGVKIKRAEEAVRTLGLDLPLKQIIGGRNSVRAGRVLNAEHQDKLLDALAEFMSLETADESSMSVTQFEKANGFGSRAIEKPLAEAGVMAKYMRSRKTGSPARILSEDDQKKILAYIDETRGVPIGADEISVEDLGKLDDSLTSQKVRTIFKRYFEEELLPRRRGLRPLKAVTLEQAERIIEISHSNIPAADEVSKHALAEALDVGDALINRAVKDLGLELPDRIFGSGQPSPAIDSKQANAIEMHLQKEINTPFAEPDVISVRKFATLHHVSPARLQQVINEELELELPDRKFKPANKIASALLAEHQAILMEYFGL